MPLNIKKVRLPSKLELESSFPKAQDDFSSLMDSMGNYAVSTYVKGAANVFASAITSVISEAFAANSSKKSPNHISYGKDCTAEVMIRDPGLGEDKTIAILISNPQSDSNWLFSFAYSAQQTEAGIARESEIYKAAEAGLSGEEREEKIFDMLISSVSGNGMTEEQKAHAKNPDFWRPVAPGDRFREFYIYPVAKTLGMEFPIWTELVYSKDKKTVWPLKNPEAHMPHIGCLSGYKRNKPEFQSDSYAPVEMLLALRDLSEFLSEVGFADVIKQNTARIATKNWTHFGDDIEGEVLRYAGGTVAHSAGQIAEKTLSGLQALLEGKNKQMLVDIKMSALEMAGDLEEAGLTSFKGSSSGIAMWVSEDDLFTLSSPRAACTIDLSKSDADVSFDLDFKGVSPLLAASMSVLRTSRFLDDIEVVRVEFDEQHVADHHDTPGF